MNEKGYYEEDLDTDEYARRHQMRYKSYSDGIAGGHGDRDDDSDWSEDEQVCTLYMLPCLGINSHFYENLFFVVNLLDHVSSEWMSTTTTQRGGNKRGRTM